MYTLLLYPEVVVLVGTFSAAWFVLGILLGRRLPKPRVAAKRARPVTKPAKNAKNAKAESGGSGGGVVELYVGNLSYDVTEDSVAKAFEPFGKVVSSRIITHKFNGKSKGFGFIEMGNRSQASAAIKGMNGKELMGRKVVVNEAKSEARDH